MSKINFEIEVVKKLETLNETQLSIETVSRWLIFHKRNAKLAVKAWKSQFAPPPPAPSTEDKEEDGNREVNEDEEEGGERLEPRKRLYLLYLANDVLQNGRKKGGEYVEAFREVMKVSFPQFVNDPAIPSELKVRAMRVLKIWEDRGVFDSDYIQEIKNGIHEVIPPSAPSSSTPSTSTSTNVSNGALSTANGSHNNNSSNDKLTKYMNEFKSHLQYLNQTTLKINQMVKQSVPNEKWRADLTQLVTSRQDFMRKLQSLQKEQEQLLKFESDLLLNMNQDPRRQSKRLKTENQGTSEMPVNIDLNILNTLVPVTTHQTRQMHQPPPPQMMYPQYQSVQVPQVVAQPNLNAPIDPNILKLFNISSQGSLDNGGIDDYNIDAEY